ncbi:MAG: PH domain-containing protein [Micropruina sp.]|uniref:PH domain-containing protein n=1 Tax=Micropruina sp. TaxID=2737536 RepID=UPI0039E71454
MPDALSTFRRPGDLWAAIGKPLTGVGAVKVRIDGVHLFVERGIITTDTQQVPLAWVQDVDASQSPTQKLRGVGTIRVHVNRGRSTETMVLTDLDDFRAGVEVINRAAREARLAETRLQHTQHVTYGHQAPTVTPSPQQYVSQRPSSEEVISSIERLARLRESGTLTDDEFARKKAELLRHL